MEKDLKEYLTPPVMLILFLLAISLIFIFPVLDMIILGAILAYGVRPIARRIQSKLKFESISILLAMILVIIPLVLLVAYIGYELFGVLSNVLASQSIQPDDTQHRRCRIQCGDFSNPPQLRCILSVKFCALFPMADR